MEREGKPSRFMMTKIKRHNKARGFPRALLRFGEKLKVPASPIETPRLSRVRTCVFHNLRDRRSYCRGLG